MKPGNRDRDPDVSVIVPIYNVEPYLRRCVDSILSQDFQSYEVLLIDDGSTDTSGQIAEMYSQKYEAVRCFHKENGGLSDARNYGIDRARGHYYALIDADDYVSSSFISTLYSTAIKHNTDIVVCDYSLVFAETPTTLSGGLGNSAVITGDEALRRLLVNRSIIDVVAWNKLYKADLFSRGVRYPVGKINEDVWTTYKLYALASSVVYIDDVLYGYYQRDGSIIHTFSAASLEVAEASSNAREWLGEKAKDYQSELDWFELRLAYRTLCRILDNGTLSEFEADYRRLSLKLTFGSLMGNPYGTVLEKVLMWLTAHVPALVFVARSMRA